MSPVRRELEAESWAFAVTIYARPGVADACLTLQSEAGVDVMLLMMAAFVAVKYRVLLNPDEIREMDEACRPWREHIVRKLRAIRTELKAGPQPAPNEETETFRSQIKALELEAEKLENRLLAEHLPPRPPGRERIRAEQLRSVLNDVVARFADQKGIKPDAASLSSIDTIVAAALQDLS